MSEPATLHYHHHPRIQPLWDLDVEIAPAMSWRGWLGIALAALLAALPLLAAVFTPEPKPAKALRLQLDQSQAELNATYLELTAARARREAADRKRSPLMITPAEAPRGHARPH